MLSEYAFSTRLSSLAGTKGAADSDESALRRESAAAAASVDGALPKESWIFSRVRSALTTGTRRTGEGWGKGGGEESEAEVDGGGAREGQREEKGGEWGRVSERKRARKGERVSILGEEERREQG